MNAFTSLLLTVVFLGALEPCSAQVSSKELRTALADLKSAARSGDRNTFASATDTILEHGDTRGLKSVIDGYATLGDSLTKDKNIRGVYQLHRDVVGSFRAVKSAKALKSVESLRTKSKHWRSRLLLLDAAAVNKEIDLKSGALLALEDKHPAVVRRSLHYLTRGKKVPIVEAIVERFLEVEAKSKKSGRDASDWERTTFAFRTALQRMLRVDLPAAIDWKNFVDANKARPDFFKRGEKKADLGRTALSLFGAAITGKNIVFVLDISGSMLSTDPIPPGEVPPKRKRGTVVGEKEKRRQKREELEARRRIVRAKKEMSRVIRSLPADVNFNVVAYSTDVDPWQETLVKASSKNKEKADTFIQELAAEGITVTDLALEEAFADVNVDTIYLVTDGAPTHVGSSRPGLPEDSLALIDSIHKDIKVLNFLRDIRIFTLGFRGAHVEFLKKLASDNSGKYVEIR